jgi:hypothetical protein
LTNSSRYGVMRGLSTRLRNGAPHPRTSPPYWPIRNAEAAGSVPATRWSMIAFIAASASASMASGTTSQPRRSKR